MEDNNKDEVKMKKEQEEKPVGEILREEGVIKDEEPSSSVTDVDEKTSDNMDFNKVLMNIEKIGAVINTLKDMDSEKEERINELAENIGEIRSLHFQKDALIRETASKLGKLEEIVEDINPRRILKKLEEKEKEIQENSAKIEKSEVVDKDLSERIIKLEEILNEVKSIENLMNIVKKLKKKVSELKDLESSTKRNAAKAEKFYLEIGERMEEFDSIKEKTRKIDELTKELLRSIDENRIELNSKLSKKDLDSILEDRLKIPETKKDESVQELENKRFEIANLLESLEKQREENLISEKSYQEILEKNRLLLSEIDKDLNKMKELKEPKNLTEWLNATSDKMKRLENIIKINEVKRKDFERRFEDFIYQIESIRSTHRYRRKEEIREPDLEEKEPEIDVDKLKRKREEVNNLLNHIENEFREGKITEKAYNEIKTKNLDVLEDIDEKMSVAGGSPREYGSSSPEAKKIRELERKLYFYKGSKKEDLKHLLKLAKEKDKQGYKLVSRKYIDKLENKLKPGLYEID